MEDVTADDYKNLKHAADTDLQKFGQQVTVALSDLDLLAPKFYIASNLPDDTKLKIYLIGDGDTLLNRIEYQQVIPVTFKNNFFQTQSIKDQNAAALPRGYYNLHLLFDDGQPENVTKTLGQYFEKLKQKVIFESRYFLGGENDDTYKTRLEEFHTRVRKKASIEFTEIKQFLLTLEGQFKNSNTTYNRLSKKRRVGSQWKDGYHLSYNQKEWSTFHNKWLSLQKQILKAADNWTPELVKTAYFHSKLYFLTRHAAITISHLHETQHSHFMNKRGVSIELKKAGEEALESITSLRKFTQQTEALPLTKNGLPRRLTNEQTTK